MSRVDNDTGRELLAALQRGDELPPDAMDAFLAWVVARDERADDLADRLKTIQRGWAA